MKKYSVLIVDDHNLFRKGLRLILNEMENIEVIGEAVDGIEFLNFLEKSLPDIVLIDINMPKLDGISATKKAIELYPDLKIIALSSYDNYENYQMMIDAGVIGFIIKNSDLIELRTGIQKAINGESYFSQQLLQNVAISIHTIKNKKEVDLNISERELEVLRYICKGMTNIEIGEKLFVHQRTVERHRANLLEKTNSKNSISLVLFAIKNGIVNI
jgi:DNA-binding NarL/FixJ family response regulator